MSNLTFQEMNDALWIKGYKHYRESVANLEAKLRLYQTPGTLPEGCSLAALEALSERLTELSCKMDEIVNDF